MEVSKIYRFALYFTAILFQEYSIIKSYSLISKTKIKINLLIVFSFISFACIEYLNITYNYSYSKPFLSLTILILLNFLIFRHSIKNIIMWSLVLYIAVGIVELFYTFLILNVFPNITLFDNDYKIKVLFTILVSLTTLLLVRIFKQINDKKKYKYLIDKRIIINLMLLSTLISSVLFAYAQNTSIKGYFVNLLIILIASSFMFMNFYQYFKVKKAEEKEIALMEFMREYEKIIDDNRIIRHEMLNNLLVIKSLINSKTKRLKDTINQIINEYDNTSNNYGLGLYNLPTGLKGLVYYKIYNLKKYNAKINIFISKTSVKKIDKIKNDTYIKVYKILGILLDNAVEACIESKDRLFVLDIYEEKRYLYFYIENSMKNKVKINQIKQKGYSTKGKNRGLGLYIVNKILEKSNELILEQDISNLGNFVSSFRVKL